MSRIRPPALALSLASAFKNKEVQTGTVVLGFALCCQTRISCCYTESQSIPKTFLPPLPKPFAAPSMFMSSGLGRAAARAVVLNTRMLQWPSLRLEVRFGLWMLSAGPMSMGNTNWLPVSLWQALFSCPGTLGADSLSFPIVLTKEA